MCTATTHLVSSAEVAAALDAHPWFAMGAGKTHVMIRLHRHGLLPLPRFVRVDIDRIRALLPETEGYDPSLAGAMTQREAGTIAEVVSEEAMARGLNVWIDSSLQDAEWWAAEVCHRHSNPAVS